MFLQLQQALQHRNQELSQLQERYARIMQHGSTAAIDPAAQRAQQEVSKLQNLHSNLVAEHEDLLILLAQMDMEARSPTTPSANINLGPGADELP